PLDGERLRETMSVGNERARHVEAFRDCPAFASEKAQVPPNDFALVRERQRERNAEQRRAIANPDARSVTSADVREAAKTDAAVVHLSATSFRLMASRSAVPSPAMAFV